MVTAFGNLEVGVVLGRDAHALGRHQIGIWVMRHRQMVMHHRHDLFQRMRTSDGQHIGMRGLHDTFARTQATRDDDLAVFTQGLADGIQRFLHGRVNEAAGIHHDQISVGIITHDLIALGTQARENAFTINRGFGAA